VYNIRIFHFAIIYQKTQIIFRNGVATFRTVSTAHWNIISIFFISRMEATSRYRDRSTAA